MSALADIPREAAAPGGRLGGPAQAGLFLALALGAHVAVFAWNAPEDRVGGAGGAGRGVADQNQLEPAQRLQGQRGEAAGEKPRAAAGGDHHGGDGRERSLRRDGRQV